MEGTLIGEAKDTGASAEGDRREGEPGSPRRSRFRARRQATPWRQQWDQAWEKGLVFTLCALSGKSMWN